MNNINGGPLKQYHHGDLKNELIYKGIYLLTREGYEGLTLRKLASFCNVSHAAPYKHFKSKEDLVSAILERIVDELEERLAMSFLISDDPEKRLVEISVQYIKLMAENPDYFKSVYMVDNGRLMEWNEDSIRKDKTLSLIMQSAKLYFEQENEVVFMRYLMELCCLIHGFTFFLINRTIKLDENYLNTAQAVVSDFLQGKKDKS